MCNTLCVKWYCSTTHNEFERGSREFIVVIGPTRIRPCSHSQFYPTRVPFANGTRRVARVHTAFTASGSSGTLIPNQEVFALDANDTRRAGAAV